MAFIYEYIYLISLLALVVFLYFLNFKQTGYPAGPYSLLLVLLSKGHLAVTLSKITKFGKVFTLWLLKMPIIVVQGTEDVREVLVKKRIDFAGRPQFPFGDTPTDEPEFMFTTDFTPECQFSWKLIYLAGKRHSSTADFPLIFPPLVRGLVSKWQQEHQGSKPFHLGNTIVNFTQALVWQIFFHSPLPDDHPWLAESTPWHQLLSKMLPLSLLARRFNFVRTYLKKPLQYLHDYDDRVQVINKLLEERKAAFKDETNSISGLNTETDLIGELLKEREEARLETTDGAKVEYLHDKNIALMVTTISSGFKITMKEAIDWVILLMGSHIDVQTKMRDELNYFVENSELDALKDGTKLVTLDSRGQLPYIQAFVQECLRFKPLQPIPLHKAAVDTKVGTHSVSKGTTVLVNLLSACHDAAYWEEPEIFRPERFLDETGQLKPPSPSYVPFGAGRRMCPAAKMSTNILFLFVCNLLLETKGKQIIAPSCEVNSKALKGDYWSSFAISTGYFNIKIV